MLWASFNVAEATLPRKSENPYGIDMLLCRFNVAEATLPRKWTNTARFGNNKETLQCSRGNVASEISSPRFEGLRVCGYIEAGSGAEGSFEGAQISEATLPRLH